MKLNIHLPGENTGRARPTLYLIIILTLLPGSLSHAAEIDNSLMVGYDSFMDRFTILERDTMETIHDFHAGLNNSFRLRRERIKANIQSFFRYGNQTINENLDSELSLSLTPSAKLNLSSNFHWKKFRQTSDYPMGNDYIQSNNSIRLKHNMGKTYRINFRGRFELIDYRKRTDFDYDYYYYDAGASFRAGSYTGNLIDLGAYTGYRESPDTTQLNFRRNIVNLDIQLSGGEQITFNSNIFGDRRKYRTNARSSYWTWFSYSSLKIRSGKRWWYLNLDTEFIQYDTTSEVFFDTYFARLGIKPKFELASTVSLFLEPRLAGLYCPRLYEEEYVELSIIAGLDILGAGNYWLTCSVEPGHRNYLAEDNDLYSDFYLARISLMGSVSLPLATELNLFVSHDPEYHSRRDDNFSITLVSLSLSRDF